MEWREGRWEARSGGQSCRGGTGTAEGGARSALGGLSDQRKEGELDEGTIRRLPGLRTILVDGD